jgi:hypothetical protein
MPAATKEEIKEWFEQGVKQGASHMIVMCDTFDWDDYPVYVTPPVDARKTVEAKNGNNMQKVMEVYNLALPMEAQLDERRAFNY